MGADVGTGVAPDCGTAVAVGRTGPVVAVGAGIGVSSSRLVVWTHATTAPIDTIAIASPADLPRPRRENFISTFPEDASGTQDAQEVGSLDGRRIRLTTSISTP